MGLPWIKVYADLPDHPKSLDLGAMLKNPLAWAHVVQMWGWCSRFARDGRIPRAHVEHAAGWKGAPGEFICAAVLCGFLEEPKGDNEHVIAHDWDVTQQAHLEKAERDAAIKAQKRRAPKVRRKCAESALEERERRGEGDLLPSEEGRRATGAVAPPAAAPPGPSPSDLQAVWNELAPTVLPRWQESSKKRLAAARQRLGERPLESWREVVRRIGASKFCCGDNDRGWVASPDWLLQPDTAAKVLEGKYDARSGARKDGSFAAESVPRSVHVVGEIET